MMRMNILLPTKFIRRRLKLCTIFRKNMKKFEDNIEGSLGDTNNVRIRIGNNINLDRLHNSKDTTYIEIDKFDLTP